MIIFLDTSGQIISDDSSEQIGRNSSNVAQIYIVTKMSPTTKFFFSFRLPNGTNRYGGFAENSEEYSASLIAENVEGYNVFIYPVRDNITEYAGTVEYTVYGVTESMRTSGTSSFSVNPAVRIDIGTEPTPNVWEDILALISRVENDKLDKVGAGDDKRAYTVNADGTQGVTPLSDEPIPDTIPVYKTGGSLAVNIGGVGDAVPLGYMTSALDSVDSRLNSKIDSVDRRVENLEQAASGNILTYVNKVGVGNDTVSAIDVPENSLKYASINKLGVHTSLGSSTTVSQIDTWLHSGSENTSCSNGVISFFPTDETLFIPAGSSITLENVNQYAGRTPLRKGLYTLNVNQYGYPVDYTVRAFSVGNGEILNKTFSYDSLEPKRFVLNEDVYMFYITATWIVTIQDSGYTEDLTKALSFVNSFETAVPRSVKAVGKNLIPPTIYAFSNWKIETIFGTPWARYALPPVPKDGRYTLSAKKSDTYTAGIISVSISKDGGATFAIPDGWSNGYFIISNANKSPATFDLKKGDIVRLSLSPITQTGLDGFTSFQFEYGDNQTAYAPYTEYEKTLPPIVVIRLINAHGISAEVCDYIDLDTLEVVKMVGTRAYSAGDEDNAEVLTDGTTTLYALAPEDIDRDDFSEYFTADNVSDVLTVEGKVWVELTDDDIAYDMTFQNKL